MKKLLNEWRRFVIKEGATNQDQELGAPLGWFSEWNSHMGMIDYLPRYKKKLEEIKPELDTLLDITKDESRSPRERSLASKAYRSINSGYAYYSKKPILPSLSVLMRDIVRIKLDNYFNDPNVPQDHKDFFSGNYERIMDYGEETMMPNLLRRGTGSSYNGLTGFKGSVQDFYMFGDGIKETRKIMDEYFKDFDRADPTEVPSSEPKDVEAHKRGEKRTADMADFFSRFYGDK
jgi:hypothetical protein